MTQTAREGGKGEGEKLVQERRRERCRCVCVCVCVSLACLVGEFERDFITFFLAFHTSLVGGLDILDIVGFIIV